MLPWLFVCAVGCCCVLCRVSGCFVPLLCSRWDLLSCCGLRCRVLCCVPGCCVAPCCCALLRPALRCCALSCVVSLLSVLPRVVLCLGALSVALGSCVVLSPRAVRSVLCMFWRGLLLCAVVCRCALCYVRPGVPCCAFPVLSALCCAGLRCAGAVASCCLLGLCCFWRLVLACVVVCRAVSSVAVLGCCALCRVVLWPAVLCCGIQRGWLAALLCGAGFCAALLSLGALLPCAVLNGPVLPCGAVVSCPAALFVFLCVLVRFLLLNKPPQFVQIKKQIVFSAFENKMNLYTTQHARRQAASPCLHHGLACDPAMVAVSWMDACGLCGPGDAAYFPPAGERRQRRRGGGTRGRRRYMVNKRGR